MTYEPIKTEQQSGKWLATSKIGPIPARVLRETEKEAVETVKFLISHHCNVPKESIQDPDWKQTNDMFGKKWDGK